MVCTLQYTLHAPESICWAKGINIQKGGSLLQSSCIYPCRMCAAVSELFQAKWLSLSPWEGAWVNAAGLSINSAWWWGSSHFLAQIQEDKKHPQLFLIHLFLERTRWGSFLPYSRGSFSVGQSWRRWVYLGKASFASGLLRGLIQPLHHRDLRVAVFSSRHRGNPFASLHEFPFIHGDLRLCSGSVPSAPASPSHALLVQNGQSAFTWAVLQSFHTFRTSKALSFISRGVTDLIWRALKWQECKTEEALHPLNSPLPTTCTCTKQHYLFYLRVIHSFSKVALTEVTRKQTHKCLSTCKTFHFLCPFFTVVSKSRQGRYATYWLWMTWEAKCLLMTGLQKQSTEAHVFPPAQVWSGICICWVPVQTKHFTGASIFSASFECKATIITHIK